jgi:diacylglycerol kinase family enzyme
MKYVIAANPVSGKRNAEKKMRILRHAAEILGPDCRVEGLDTDSAGEFCRCVRDLAQKNDILVIAGGDGTLSDAINSLDTGVLLGYLPFGSACALAQALKLPHDIQKAALQIKNGIAHPVDLILCQESKKAVMASIDINAHTLSVRQKLIEKGIKGCPAYVVGTVVSLLRYDRTDVTVTADGETFAIPNAISTIIAKTPSFGFGMNIVPQAKVDDGFLHLLAVNAGFFRVIYGMLKSFFAPLNAGLYKKAHRIHITTKDPRYLQVDGNIYVKDTEFDFRILPGALRLKY